MEYAKVPQEINNMVGDNVKLLAQLFPATVKDGQVDFEALKQELGQFEEVGKEKYELTWSGKQDAKKLAQEDVFNRTLKYIPEDSKNPETTENLYIEGDNLEVLKLLRQNYYGAIKMIYIDPPYNTGRNLIYKNDYSSDKRSYLRDTDAIDELGNKLVANPRTSGRFHSDWLSMMYQRLKVAKQLLTKDGVLVCAIDENEQATLMLILQEVFDEQCYDHVCISVVHNPRGVQGINFSYTHEYAIFVFPKGEKVIADRHIDENDVSWSQLRNWGGESERTDAKNCFYPILVKDNIIIGFGDVCADSFHPTQTECRNDVAYVYPIDRNGVERKWRYARQSVEAIKDMLRVRKTTTGYEIEIGKQFGLQKTIWNDTKYDANEYGTKIVNDLVPGGGFTFPKSLYTVYDAVYAATINDKKAIILDFFSGSSTTAHAAMLLNQLDGGKRKFIMVQLPVKSEDSNCETICEIAKKRIRRAGEKIKQEIEAANVQLKLGEEPKQFPDIGFKVFRTADTNIKWNLVDTIGQLSTEEMTHTPDLADFTQGFTDIDVVYEVMLRQKDVPLSSTLETLSHIGSRTYLYGSAYLVCLETEITEALIDKLAALDPLPIKYIFRDSAFKDDINLKDETFRRLKNLIERNSGVTKQTYTVEFI